MKKTLKRTLCLLLSALMTAVLFTSLPLTAGAATANDESVGATPTAYAVITKTPNTSRWSTLTFRYDTNMPNNAWDVSNTDFEAEEAPWFDENLWEYGWDDRITRIVFEPSFANARPTSTANWFYLMMNGLDEDEYPETIEGLNYLNTSCVTDMKGMFFQTSFSYLDVSGWDTSNVTDMREMFCFCESLTSLDVSTWDTGNVTDMYRMFDWCVSLNDLDVSGWDTSNVTDMHEMFDGCSGLSQLDVSSWNTSNVTDMYAIFNGCSGLSQLDVSSWDTSNVTDMFEMFDDCSGLSQLDVSSWDTGNVTNTSIMFRGCNSLTSLDLSSWDISKVTNMSSIFDGCGALETIKVADKNVDWSSSTATSNNMFSDCTSLEGKSGGIEYDSNITDINGAKVIGGYFTAKPRIPYAVLNGTTLTFKYDANMPNTNAWDVSNTNYGGISNPAPWGRNITTVVFDESFANARPTSTAYWFYGCGKLTSVVGINYFNTSCVTDMKYMFYECDILPSLDLSNFDTSNVTDMSAMFSSCDSLSSLDVSHFDTSNVVNMEFMFGYCPSLSSLDVSHFDTSNVTDMSAMFSSCDSLSSLDVSNWDTSNVTDMSDMFIGCGSLSSLDVSNWDTSNVTDMSDMFNECINLPSLDLSHFDTSNVVNMGFMFGYCLSLSSLDLSNFDTSNVTDMSNMFSGCSALETIWVDDDTVDWSTGSAYYSDDMFTGCTSLEGKSGGIEYDSNITDINGAKVIGGYFTVKGIKYFVAHNLTLAGDIGVNFGIDLHDIEPANARVTLEWYKYETEYIGNLVPKGSLYIATANVAAKEIADTITAKLYDGDTLVETDTYSVKEYADKIIKTADLSDLGITVSNEKAAALKDLCKAMLKYGSASEAQFDETWNHSDAHPVTATEGIDYTGYQPAAIPSYTTPDYSEVFAPYGIEYYGSSIGTKTKTGYLLVFKAPAGSNPPTIQYNGENIAPQNAGTNAISYQINDIHAKYIPDDIVVTVGGNEVHFNMLAYINKAAAKGGTLKALVEAFYDYGAKAKAYFNA